jgi:hypothetical protein
MPKFLLQICNGRIFHKTNLQYFLAFPNSRYNISKNMINCFGCRFSLQFPHEDFHFMAFTTRIRNAFNFLQRFLIVFHSLFLSSRSSLTNCIFIPKSDFHHFASNPSNLKVFRYIDSFSVLPELTDAFLFAKRPVTITTVQSKRPTVDTVLTERGAVSSSTAVQ